MKFADCPNLIEQLNKRLQEPLPSKDALAMMFPNIKTMPENLNIEPRLSAVMLLLFVKNYNWHVLAIRRTEDGHAHSGQIGFPGGRYEDEDKDLLITALRETYEEVGLHQQHIKTIGALSPVYISVSNFRVFPYVGFIEHTAEWNINTDEVSAVIEIPLSELLSPEAKVQTEVVSPALPNIKRKVNAYRLLDNTIIWGATAIIIAELELLLKGNGILNY
jgi:8-oxo-dGTP pyrophosphatase MutT (NUDIX family)